MILQAVVENYEEYKDYNTTTTQSDYGENLHVLLDFLRLKSGYDRQAWLIRPLTVVHEVLAKSPTAVQADEGNGPGLAAHWQQQVERLTSAAADLFIARLTALEKAHGMRLRTVTDRIRERFVQSFALDRLCALIEPAFDAARSTLSESVLEQLEIGLQPYLQSPAGVGLDVPAWLRRLEGELHRVIMRRMAISHLSENLIQIPRLIVPLENLREQLQDWPKP